MKSDMMKYKGYKATIGYDKDDNIFVGEVFGVEDSLNFHGHSIEELEKAFKDCIENYLSICKQIGKEPQKEFSGSFNVRTTSQIHERASEYAAENGCSLNQVVSMAMEAFLGNPAKAN
jgi:predicted HicB family RNase H-like nuclease